MSVASPTVRSLLETQSITDALPTKEKCKKILKWIGDDIIISGNEKIESLSELEKNTIYNEAVILAENTNISDKEKAIIYFNFLKKWNDSEERLKNLHNDLHYLKGKEAFEKNDYVLAKDFFEKCENWSNSAEYLSKCNSEISLIQKKKLFNKIKILVVLTIIVISSGFYMVKNNENNQNQFLQDIKTANVGRVIDFGEYQQDNTEPIKWTVIKKSNDSVLLLSNKVIDFVDYSDDGEEKDVTWETSDARLWLNTSFYNIAFSSFEKDFILETELDTEGLTTYDKIFLLSEEEYEALSSKTKEATITAYAATKLKNSEKGMYLGYTLRAKKGVYAVDHKGDIENNTHHHYWDCIRPAMWISTTPIKSNE